MRSRESPATRAIVAGFAPSACACRIAAWSSVRASARRGSNRSTRSAAFAIRFIVSTPMCFLPIRLAENYTMDLTCWPQSTQAEGLSGGQRRIRRRRACLRQHGPARPRRLRPPDLRSIGRGRATVDAKRQAASTCSSPTNGESSSSSNGTNVGRAQASVLLRRCLPWRSGLVEGGEPLRSRAARDTRSARGCCEAQTPTC
jgi:hypothetical protein